MMATRVLLQLYHPMTNQSHHSQYQHLISWKPLPPLPLRESTAATLCGQLVLIGGDRSGLFVSRVKSIHQLVDGQWVEIGSMASGRYDCLVASPSPDKIIIVGGVGAEDSVEECVVV